MEDAPNIDLRGGGGRLVYDKARRTIVSESKRLPRYRHLKRGTTYRVLFEAAKISSTDGRFDDVTVVVYQGEVDGLVWVRPAIEFFDGRFEWLPPVPNGQCDGE